MSESTWLYILSVASVPGLPIVHVLIVRGQKRRPGTKGNVSAHMQCRTGPKSFTNTIIIIDYQ